MKKVLSLFAIMAVLAMGFASCEGQDSKDFKITVSEVTETTANVLVEPADTTATYYLTCYPTKSIATMDDDSLSLVIAAELEYLKQFVAAMGMPMSLPEILEIVLLKGNHEQELTSMNLGTDYTVVVAKMDFQGVINGKIAKKNFTTKEAVLGQLTFSFENTGSSVIVFPSNNYEAWDYSLLTAEEYAEFNNDKNVAAEDAYAYYGTESASPGAKEFSFEEIATYIGTGDMTLLTYACDAKGITSEVAEYKFNVPAPAGAPAKKVAKESIANFKNLKKVEKKFNAIKAMKK
ncbi:MAG: hypothetical protein UH084_01880 [Paludibacteraceae bacterium]|nr:hypothetical protein [Paludibacteraceae bacterium]